MIHSAVPEKDSHSASKESQNSGEDQLSLLGAGSPAAIIVTGVYLFLTDCFSTDADLLALVYHRVTAGPECKLKVWDQLGFPADPRSSQVELANKTARLTFTSGDFKQVNRPGERAGVWLRSTETTLVCLNESKSHLDLNLLRVRPQH